MSISVMQNERLVELLVQRAIDGLNAQERAELKWLLAQEEYVDAGRFEQTAAELLLAGEVIDEPLPHELRAQLLAQAESFDAPAMRALATNRVTNVSQQRARRPRRSWTNTAAGFAVAASVLVAIIGWWPRLQTGGDADLTAQVSPDPNALRQRRNEMLSQQGVIQRTWQATQDPAASGVRGDVVWDPTAQKGYLRFQGLQANDARRLQYQLWIFDATRDDKYPVDGGVFDIPATANTGENEVIVPIVAKLPIRQAAMFAVTLEKPGGSVVSSREHIVVVAPVTAAG